MKLLPARYMLDRAQANGKLRPNGPVAEIISGTFGLAPAMLAAGFCPFLGLSEHNLFDRFR